MLSMKVLQDHKEKFGVDFAKNKLALNDTCKISSKTLKNKLAGYITKFIKNELDILCLRYFNVYGIGQTAGVIEQFLRNLKEHKPPIINGNGEQLRDFINVEDVARANLVAMESQIKNEFFNIGTGRATSILQLAEIIINSSYTRISLRFRN